MIPVGMTHYMMLRRNLIYTGVTRGKKLVVLVGQRKAIGIAVRSAEGGRRWSKLRELLESAGFSVSWVHGGLTGEPLSSTSTDLILGAERRHG